MITTRMFWIVLVICVIVICPVFHPPKNAATPSSRAAKCSKLCEIVGMDFVQAHHVDLFFEQNWLITCDSVISLL